MSISIVRALLIASLPALLSASTAAPSDEQSEPLSAVHAFHAALARGDGKGALALLAEDAVILESGFTQTREQYAREHLGEDIAFGKAVQTTHPNEAVYHEAGVAWTIATTRTQGNFNGLKIDGSGVELIVLTKQDGKWRLRAIHWSSHTNESKEKK